MSRYDDPGTDPAYCDPLSDPPAEPDRCPYCGGPLSGNCEIRDDWYPYCGAVCSINAEREGDD